MSARLSFVVVVAGLAIAATSAAASGPVPFYGYSPYFGRPAPYYTDDGDVQVSSTQSYGLPGFGTRVYSRGGPFYARQTTAHTLRAPRRSGRRHVVLRRRG